MSDAELDAPRPRRPVQRTNSKPSPEHIDDGHLLAYRAQRLGPAESSEVERHLSRCPACRELLARLGEPVPLELDAWASQAWERPPRPIPLAARHTVNRPSTWRRAAYGGGGLAAAAAVLFLALPRGPAERLPSPASYVLEPLRGGLARTRAAATSSAVPEFPPEGRIRALLRPAHPDKDGRPPRLSVSVSVEGSPSAPVPVRKLDRYPSGALSVELDADAVYRRPGTHELVFRVDTSEPGTTPSPYELKARLRFRDFTGAPL